MPGAVTEALLLSLVGRARCSQYSDTIEAFPKAVSSAQHWQLIYSCKYAVAVILQPGLLITAPCRTGPSFSHRLSLPSPKQAAGSLQDRFLFCCLQTCRQWTPQTGSILASCFCPLPHELLPRASPPLRNNPNIAWLSSANCRCGTILHLSPDDGNFYERAHC